MNPGLPAAQKMEVQRLVINFSPEPKEGAKETWYMSHHLVQHKNMYCI